MKSNSGVATKQVSEVAPPGEVASEKTSQTVESPGFHPYGEGNFPSKKSSSEFGSDMVAEKVASSPQARPSKIPKPPKGRLFVGAILIACLGFGCFQTWNTFFRYQAYGIISGEIVELHAPWNGGVKYIHVQEGEHVRQGQLLMTLDNVELEQKYAQLADELKVAQATLEGERSRLKSQAGWNIHQHQEAIAEYYKAWGELLAEKSKLSEKELAYSRVTRLNAAGASSADELDRSTLNYHGQREKVEKLTSRLVELKKRIDLSTGMVADITPQLEPLIAKIEAVHAQRARVRKMLERGLLRAPTDGLVVRRDCAPGEYCSQSDSVLALLKQGSLEIILYLPQDMADAVGPGDRLEVTIDPYPKSVPSTVERLGDVYQTAPEQIERYYGKNDRLLPVHLRPEAEYAQWMALRIGGVVKLPLGTKVHRSRPQHEAGHQSQWHDAEDK